MSVQDQHPIGTGLDAVSDAADALEGVDLTGRVALVTGGSSGLGSETVEAGGAMTGGVEPYAVDPAPGSASVMDTKRSVCQLFIPGG